ncbi:eukaryotic translation initiation factor eIF2A [Colletotrichum gloeosporioides Cg-14]|uniref:Eukaryotic translation initiation factor eIF2A n=1 Tax=Colletotrichum gloeosporioides (strain Cg-14) TaxID=1237896 RepID=T0JNH2_COLGC|nr:eukaryotic translation initiation factor eIF2A [Colletotrichum gloeosporioides Cg-14]
MNNGSAPIGPNGFGRPRRGVPGAEFSVPGAAPKIPGAETAEGDENLSKAALKNKKKRNNKKKEGEANPEGQNGGGASLAPPPRDFGRSGHEGRSPERRGGGGGGNNHRHRSHSRNPGAPRNRSNTHRGQNGAPQAPNNAQQAATANDAGADGQNPNAKKIRSLQKKVRAIEDLEMRLAGGEKLEDTQMKKIGTKTSVLKELEGLEKEGR